MRVWTLTRNFSVPMRLICTSRNSTFLKEFCPSIVVENDHLGSLMNLVLLEQYSEPSLGRTTRNETGRNEKLWWLCSYSKLWQNVKIDLCRCLERR